MIEVNDIQSKLNPTFVKAVEFPRSTDDLAATVWSAYRRGHSFAICGGRHSMGGQQFSSRELLIDTTRNNQILHLDRERGTVSVQAGIQWPELMQGLSDLQAHEKAPWVIREKQTGVDKVSIGGSLSSNVHGRGLTAPPFISDIESLRVINGRGEILNVSRSEHSELFSLVCGGYGLFGVVAEVTLRLVRRYKVERKVEIIPVATLIDRVQERVQSGFIFGDCQYAVDIDRQAHDYPGVFSCYRPLPDNAKVSDEPKKFSQEQWGALYKLLRHDKRQAFEQYATRYRATDGQVYWSDTHQLAGDFFEGYRIARDHLGGSELILEVYVSHENFTDFMAASRRMFLERNADVVFGTVRFIKKDSESFLAWARQDFVCIVCNLHVAHSEQGVQKVADDFRALIDQVLYFNGSYYLTYHRFARRDQLLKAYPQFPEFLSLKRKYDPDYRFMSDWFRHYGA